MHGPLNFGLCAQVSAWCCPSTHRPTLKARGPQVVPVAVPLLRAPLPHAEVEGVVPAIPDVLQMVLGWQLRDVAVDRPAIGCEGGPHIVLIRVIVDFDEADLR